MLLKLSERVPVWHYGEYHFSVLDRGPKDIDIDSLDALGRDAVRSAINMRVLLEDDGDAGQSQTSETIEQPNKVPAVDPREKGLKVRAKTQLKGSAKIIANWCKKSANYKMLTYMLEIEESKQKRKSVVKAIKEALKTAGGVSAVIDDVNDSETIEINVA